MHFAGKNSRYNIGDKIQEYTVADVGVLGSKLSKWCFVYTLRDNWSKLYDLISEEEIDNFINSNKNTNIL